MIFGRTLLTALLLGAASALPTLCGCLGDPEQPAVDDRAVDDLSAAEPLLVTVVGSQETADVLRRELASRSESSLEVAVVEADRAAEQARLNSDLVLFPAPLLGELAQAQALLPLDESLRKREAFDQDDLLPLAREYDGAWGGQTLALPLGSPLPVLVYRADVLEQAGLQPPQTWEEYGAAAAKLRELQENGELPADVTAVVAEPTEATDAARELLVRSAAYVRVPGRYSGLFDFASMKPEISSEAFVRALEEYQAALSDSPSTERPATYEEVSRSLLSGEAALGVTFLLDVPELESEESLVRAAKVSVAPVPGAAEYWQPRESTWERREAAVSAPAWGDFGLLIGLGRSVADRERALRALESIVDAEIGTPVSTSADGTAPYRESQLASIARWTDLPEAIGANAQYADALRAMQSSPDHLLLPRIPGRERYLQTLGEEVVLALNGEKTAADALTDAAVAWDAITNETGREAQIDAYRASLGISD